MNGSRDDAGPPPSNNRNEDEGFNAHNEQAQQPTTFRPHDREQQQHPRTKPDYGEVLLSNDIRHAPKSLDHFKRGYQERVVQRDKEFYSRRHGSDGRGAGAGAGGRSTTDGGEQRGEGRATGGNNMNEMDRSGGRRAGNTSRFTEPTAKNDPWSQNYRDRPTILQGLDINALCDRLTPKLHSKEALFAELDRTRQQNEYVFESGKAMTALISVAARRKNIGLGHAVWDWMDYAGLTKNTFHYNSMISVTEKARNYQRALDLLQEMTDRSVPKNEVTFSSAISACEKSGQWKIALDLLNAMESENVGRTAIAYNAAISACEKGLVPQKACEVFQRMRREGIAPSVVSFSALISAAEKGGQWRLALEILEEMKREGFHGNVVAYSAAISALAKGQQWQRALQLFREIQSHGGQPSIVTYNATMTALEKGMQWEKALDLFEEMKMRNLPITVVSYGSAISACDKGFQYRQCLEFLDEMTEMGIQKNVIIFGAAMSCMEKCSRADIGFQLMKRMKEDGIQPNVHIFNSAISACARSNLWEKGYELYLEMERVGVNRDVVTYNAVLDAVCSQIRLGRDLFIVGVERGFYAKVSRLGESWFELDLHFLSLGGGEIALGWWFEECLVPYLQNTDKLESVKSISIVTGYGKTRTRGRRHGDDGMRKRCKAMLSFMNIKEHDQSNLGRIHVDKESLIEEVKKNGGKIIFDLDGYLHWKETETTANVIPDTAQKIRARFAPTVPGSGRPPFTRIESDNTSEEYRLEYQKVHGRSIDKADGEYRSDIDYAVRDGTRFEKGSERFPSGTPAPGSRRGINEEATNNHYSGDGSGGGGGGRVIGSWDGGSRGGKEGKFDQYGPGERRGQNRFQDQPSTAMGQSRGRSFNGSQDGSQKRDGPDNFMNSGRRYDQETRDTGFSGKGGDRDRWVTQAHDPGRDFQRSGGDGHGDNQSGRSNNGGASNRHGRDPSRYGGDNHANGRHPEERSSGVSRHADNNSFYLNSGARSQEYGGSRGDMSPNQNRLEGRNSGPSQSESVLGGWREQAQRPTQHANQDDRYSHNDQHHRDDDRKRPFNDDSDRASGDFRRHDSDGPERRSSTGSRGYTLDPPPTQRRRQS